MRKIPKVAPPMAWVCGGLLIALLALFDASMQRQRSHWTQRLNPFRGAFSGGADEGQAVPPPRVLILDVIRSLHRLHVEVAIVNEAAADAAPAEGRVWGVATFGEGAQRSEIQSYKARLKTFKGVEFALPGAGLADVTAAGGVPVNFEIFVSDDRSGAVTKVVGSTAALLPSH